MRHSSTMLRLMTGGDQSQSDEATLATSCLLFRATNDSIMSILSYLSMANICSLDIAVTNSILRVIWLSILRGTSHRTISNHKHSHESIRWLVERGISPEYLQMSEDGSIANKIDGGTLLGLDISSLRNISLCRCDIGDEDILSIAHGCPNLTEIRLLDCCDITDASMIALGRYCRQLIFIDIGGCTNISDIGLMALGDACCNVIGGINLTEMGNGSALRKISLSYCKRITDISLVALGRGCHSLYSINLSGCSEITDTAVSALGQGCPLLTDICISGCANITDGGISALGQGCPLLREINLCIRQQSARNDRPMSVIFLQSQRLISLRRGQP